MTPQETEQFAALRMHVAHLVNALSGVVQTFADGPAPMQPAIDAARAALAESEPSVRDILAEADRDAKLKACREQLAGTTARLAVVEGKARHLLAIGSGGTIADTMPDVQGAMDELAEALR